MSCQLKVVKMDSDVTTTKLSVIVSGLDWHANTMQLAIAFR